MATLYLRRAASAVWPSRLNGIQSIGVRRPLAILFLVLLVSCGGGPRPLDFQVTLYDGTAFQLSGEAGKNAVVLNFWYPSCPPCRAEMPDFEIAWQRVQGQPVRFLGLFVPQGLDSELDASNFIAELGLTYDFATDKGAEIAQSYQLAYFPTTIFIDRDGRVFKTHISVLDADKITRIVQEMTGG